MNGALKHCASTPGLAWVKWVGVECADCGNANVTGFGVTPKFSVSRTSVSFGGLPVGENKPDSIFVTNTGTSTTTSTDALSVNGHTTLAAQKS